MTLAADLIQAKSKITENLDLARIIEHSLRSLEAKYVVNNQPGSP
jgi:hypothetical protein